MNLVQNKSLAFIRFDCDWVTSYFILLITIPFSSSWPIWCNIPPNSLTRNAKQVTDNECLTLTQSFWWWMFNINTVTHHERQMFSEIHEQLWAWNELKVAINQTLQNSLNQYELWYRILVGNRSLTKRWSIVSLWSVWFIDSITRLIDV